MGNAFFDLPVQNPRVPVFFLLRSLLGLNYSTDAKQHFKELLAARHMHSQRPASSEQRGGLSRGEEVGTRSAAPHTPADTHPHTAEQERKCREVMSDIAVAVTGKC